MSKFHVGDKVRIHATNSRSAWLNGDTGLVVKVVEDSNVYHVSLDSRKGTFWFIESELRPADIVAYGFDPAFTLEPGETVHLVKRTGGEEAEVGDKIEVQSYVIGDAVDVVNHPPHYNRFPVEVINITEQLDFNRGNAVKYLARAGFKEGVDELEDLSKAAWYVNRAIEKLTKEREDG